MWASRCNCRMLQIYSHSLAYFKSRNNKKKVKKVRKEIWEDEDTYRQSDRTRSFQQWWPEELWRIGDGVLIHQSVHRVESIGRFSDVECVVESRCGGRTGGGGRQHVLPLFEGVGTLKV